MDLLLPAANKRLYFLREGYRDMHPHRIDYRKMGLACQLWKVRILAKDSQDKDPINTKRAAPATIRRTLTADELADLLGNQ